MNKLCLNMNYLEYLLGLYTPNIENGQIYPTTLQLRHIGKSRATWLFVQQLVQGKSKEKKFPHNRPFVIGFLSPGPIMRSFHVITSHAYLLTMIPQCTRDNAIITSKWRRFGVIIALLLRHVSAETLTTVNTYFFTHCNAWRHQAVITLSEPVDFLKRF